MGIKIEMTNVLLGEGGGVTVSGMTTDNWLSKSEHYRSQEITDINNDGKIDGVRRGETGRPQALTIAVEYVAENPKTYARLKEGFDPSNVKHESRANMVPEQVWFNQKKCEAMKAYREFKVALQQGRVTEGRAPASFRFVDSSGQERTVENVRSAYRHDGKLRVIGFTLASEKGPQATIEDPALLHPIQKNLDGRFIERPAHETPSHQAAGHPIRHHQGRIALR